MEIEKLIEILRGKCAVCKRSSCIGKYWQLSSCPATCEAADALEQLQAELERVRVERDAYEVYFMAVSSKPDCNTCEKMGCEYRPRVGDTVRANCPLYSGPEKEE